MDYPWGSLRTGGGNTLPTRITYTGQRDPDIGGLMYYNARWYDPVLGRFAQADTIVPEPGDPQSLNRYSYVSSNPLRYIDPSGNCPQPTGELADANIICVAGFIATDTSTGIPLYLYFIGDGRDFSSNSSPYGSRFWVWINADTGEIAGKFVHPTQQASGPNGQPEGDPYPPRNEEMDNKWLEAFLGSNHFSANKADDGTITFSYQAVCSHPVCNSLLAPDGVLYFTPDGKGSYTPSGRVNEFPNLEAYHWNNGNLQGDGILMQLQNFSASEITKGNASFSTSLGMARYEQFGLPANQGSQRKLFHALQVR